MSNHMSHLSSNSLSVDSVIAVVDRNLMQKQLPQSKKNLTHHHVHQRVAVDLKLRLGCESIHTVSQKKNNL